MELIQFVFATAEHFVGVCIVLVIVFKGLTSVIRAIRGMPEPVEDDDDGTDCENILERVEGGVFKRIDENRELLELLERQAPDLLQQHPQLVGWLRSHDTFLTALADSGEFDDEACAYPARPDTAKPFPRALPLLLA